MLANYMDLVQLAVKTRMRISRYTHTSIHTDVCRLVCPFVFFAGRLLLFVWLFVFAL